LIKEELILDKVLEKRRQMPRLGCRKIYYLIKPDLEDLGIKYGRDKLFNLLGNKCLLVSKRKQYTKTTDSKHWMRKYPNLTIDLVPSRPEQLWVADITYITGRNKRHYLHLITDAYSKQIMGYELCRDLEAKSTLRALNMALSKRRYPEKELIHHSDRGLQYCSKLYTDILKNDKIRISMTENGDPYENAIAERVNGILKDEFGLDDIYGSTEDAVMLTKESIDIYNRLRPHLSCSMMTPIQMHKQDKIKIKTWKYKAPNNRKSLEAKYTFT